MADDIKVPFLVIASSPYMRGILKFVLETILHTDVTELESEERALSFLKNVPAVPSLIVYHYTPHGYLLEDFIGYLRDHSKTVRIIVLVSEVREEAKDLLKSIPQLTLMDESHLPNALVEEAKKSFEGTHFLNQEEYCRIDIDFLSILDGINKNLFIRIGSSKYIRVYNEDDNTNILDIKKYKTKGIDYLYVKRDTALWVTNQIQSQISIFLKANNFKFILRGASDTPTKRFEQKIFRIDDEVHIDKEFKENIEKTVERILSTVSKDVKVESLLKSFKTQNESYALYTQKMTSTSIISCALAKQLEWISKTTMEKLVYASVLCDITLAVKPELIKIRNLEEFEAVKSTLSEADQKIFLSHPRDAANLIKNYFNAAPPDTDSLAYLHHELPDATGFPQGLKAEKISPLAALFIVANDFAYYYLKDDEPNLDDFLLKCQSRYDYMNFRKIIKALERIKRK